MDEADYFSFIRAGSADEESFQQEFMCQPADDNTAFLPYDLIAAANTGKTKRGTLICWIVRTRSLSVLT